MRDYFRKQTFERLIKESGVVTNLVIQSLDVKKDIEFKPTGINLGPGTSILVPPNPIQPDGSVNIMFQFRGGSSKLFSKAGVNAIIVMADAGGKGGGPSRTKFGSAAFVNQSVATILAELQKQSGKQVKLGKLGLSGWSGGYDPIHGIMQDNYSGNKLIKEPDYVGLFDGLHHSTQPGNPAMKTWSRLAQNAAAGKGQFVITHSAVIPGNYPSTTDTTNYLLKDVGLTRGPVKNWAGQFSVKPVSEANQGNFSVYQLYSEPQPYMVNGKTNVPGTSGYQHIEALRGLPDFWPKDWH